jgi:hypothetical protein
MRAPRLLVWVAAAVLVILLGRTIGYAAMPSPLAGLYAHEAGGPSLPEIALVALSIAGTLAVTVCWLAALGVHERQLLERRALARPLPRLRPRRIVLHAVSLWVVAAPTAGVLEAYIHWRAGLGWHGVHCLVGPVHRDLIPIIGALSLVAAAAVAAGELLLAWMRRTFTLVRAARLRLVVFASVRLPIESRVPRERFRAARAGARAPPATA